MLFYRADCRHFSGEKPCAPHKAEGVQCRDCPRYEPVTERILIVKLDAAGDVLRTTCILPAFRKHFPQASLWWVTDPSSSPLLEGHPGVDVVLGLDASLSGVLSATSFSLGFNFDMSRRACGILQAAGAPVNRGFGLSAEGAVVPLNDEAEDWYEMGIFDPVKRANTRTYPEHLFRIAGFEYAGERPELHLTHAERERAGAFAGKYRLARFDAVLGLNVGAGGRWALKRWRPEGFAALARRVKRRYPRTGILLFGGPEERELLPTLARRLKGAALPTGTDNTLRDFAALVDLCDVVVTGDTLALHVAVALGKRVVAYFGPTSDAEIDLYGRGEKILPEEPCRCYYQPACLQERTCMDSLSEKRMFLAVERQLKASAATI
jgi:heptosyltransferase-2